LSQIKRDYLSKEYPIESYENTESSPRKTLEDSFFTKNGHGGKLIGEFEKLKKALTLPKFLTEAFKKMDQGSNLDDVDTQRLLEKFRDNFCEDQYYILPSFYKLIIYLRKIKKEFAILFRSFGNDFDSVAMEFNQFPYQLC
jgi:hypothetical protein